MPLIHLTFFTRRNCHLCDSALWELRRELAGVAHELVLVDIDDDRRYFAGYDHHVPVIWVNGTELCRHRLDREKLGAAIRKLA